VRNALKGLQSQIKVCMALQVDTQMLGITGTQDSICIMCTRTLTWCASERAGSPQLLEQGGACWPRGADCMPQWIVVAEGGWWL